MIWSALCGPFSSVFDKNFHGLTRACEKHFVGLMLHGRVKFGGLTFSEYSRSFSFVPISRKLVTVSINSKRD